VKLAANLVLITTEIASWPSGGSHSSLASIQDLTSGRNVDRIMNGYITSIGGAGALGKSYFWVNWAFGEHGESLR
jgi:hypothetical protein